MIYEFVLFKQYINAYFFFFFYYGKQNIFMVQKKKKKMDTSMSVFETDTLIKNIVIKMMDRLDKLENFAQND